MWEMSLGLVILLATGSLGLPYTSESVWPSLSNIAPPTPLFFLSSLSGALTRHTLALFTLSSIFPVLTFTSPNAFPLCHVCWAMLHSLLVHWLSLQLCPICFSIHTLCFKSERQHSAFLEGLLNQFKIHLLVFYNLSFFSYNFSTLF